MSPTSATPASLPTVSPVTAPAAPPPPWLPADPGDEPSYTNPNTTGLTGSTTGPVGGGATAASTAPVASPFNADGSFHAGIDSNTGLQFGNVPGYSPGGTSFAGAPSMFDPRTGQNTTDPSQFAGITAFDQAQDAAAGQTVSPTQYTDVAQIAGTDPSVYAQQLANANPNASDTQKAGITAVNGGAPVTAGTATDLNPITGIPQLKGTDNLAGLPAGSVAATTTPMSQAGVSQGQLVPADTALPQPSAVSPTSVPTSVPAGVGTATDTGGSMQAPTALSNPQLTSPADIQRTDQTASTTPGASLASALQSASGGVPASTNPAVGAGVSASPTDPTNALTNQPLSVGATNDPVQMALQSWQTSQNSTEPQYQADLRDALRSAAAGGALGSGQLNTSLGDITNQRQLAGTTSLQNLLQTALQTQNSNAYANLNQADQQQQFQAGQQGTAFNQSLAGTQEQSALNSTAFAQALSQLTAGMANNPAQMQATLSQIFGNNAAQANAALAALTKSSATNSTTAGSTSDLANAIKQYIAKLGGGTGTQTSTPTSGGGATYNPNDPTNDPSDPSTWTGGISSNYGG